MLEKPLGRLSTAERAAAVALQQVGVPYRYGGQSPSGFDCSGLVHYSFARAGASVPRTTQQLWSASQFVDEGQLREGDLLFFRFDGKIAHVGMYLGDGRFVHAPSSGKFVSVQSMRSEVYRDAFVRAGRL
ncbi:MAG: C40 family peptidase [Woeseiaceae bacterium]|nr:C40 family peptidase [Woeseiaceae bacterium]